MKFTGRYHKINRKDGTTKGGQVYIPKELDAKINLKHREEIILDYNEETKILMITTLNPVNYPHLIGVGMSCEGYGQQVDKEA